MSYANRLRVTPMEFEHKVLPALSSLGWNHHQLEQFRGAYHSEMTTDSRFPSRTARVDEATLEHSEAFFDAHKDAMPAIGPEHRKQAHEVMERYIKLRS
jgi:hypothetical protein